MAIVDRATLKTFFETGDHPSQSQFATLIDSCINIVDDGGALWILKKILYSDFQPSSDSEVTFLLATILVSLFQVLLTKLILYTMSIRIVMFVAISPYQAQQTALMTLLKVNLT